MTLLIILLVLLAGFALLLAFFCASLMAARIFVLSEARGGVTPPARPHS